ncbi:hypothetical protein VNI00_004878 [Paramarasmius palmivorus]|uniref:Uncharacterized protein n=1 Tax=Paramarasmius palmivorus TaxID=297713 RepID=A0AAW0DJR2_9AGAR
MSLYTRSKFHKSLKLARQTFIRTLIHHNARGKPSRILSTVLPSQIQPEDIIDISGSKRPNVGFLPALYATHGLRYIVGHASKPVKFPENTKGFLYFHSPGPTAPSSLYTIRFRRCGNAEEARNGGGKDLMLPNGWDPWEKSMGWMVKSGIVDALVQNGTITKPPTSRDLAIYDTLFAKKHKNMVYKPGQTFSILLDPTKGTVRYSLFIVGDGEVVPLFITGWDTFRAKLAFKDNLVLHLHLRISASLNDSTDTIQILLSADATSRLRKGMVLPHVSLTRHVRKPMGTPDGEGPLESAMRILKKQMQLEENV